MNNAPVRTSSQNSISYDNPVRLTEPSGRMVETSEHILLSTWTVSNPINFDDVRREHDGRSALQPSSRRPSFTALQSSYVHRPPSSGAPPSSLSPSRYEVPRRPVPDTSRNVASSPPAELSMPKVNSLAQFTSVPMLSDRGPSGTTRSVSATRPPYREVSNWDRPPIDMASNSRPIAATSASVNSGFTSSVLSRYVGPLDSTGRFIAPSDYASSATVASSTSPFASSSACEVSPITSHSALSSPSGSVSSMSDSSPRGSVMSIGSDSSSASPPYYALDCPFSPRLPTSPSIPSVPASPFMSPVPTSPTISSGPASISSLSSPPMLSPMHARSPFSSPPPVLPPMHVRSHLTSISPTPYLQPVFARRPFSASPPPVLPPVRHRSSFSSASPPPVLSPVRHQSPFSPVSPPPVLSPIRHQSPFSPVSPPPVLSPIRYQSPFSPASPLSVLPPVHQWSPNPSVSPPPTQQAHVDHQSDIPSVYRPNRWALAHPGSAISSVTPPRTQPSKYPRSRSVISSGSPPPTGSSVHPSVSPLRTPPSSSRRGGSLSAKKRNADSHGVPKLKKGSRTCPLCDRSFGNYTDLKRHVRTHDMDGPTLLCGGLPYDDAVAAGLRIETATQYEHDGVIYFGGCLKTYSRPDALARHLADTSAKKGSAERCLASKTTPYNTARMRMEAL